MFVVVMTEPEWDIANVARFRELVAPTVTQQCVIVDMTAVEYIDSSCLTALMDMYRHRVLEQKFPPAHIVAPSKTVRRLFEITGFDRIWLLYDTLDDATKAAQIEQEAMPP